MSSRKTSPQGAGQAKDLNPMPTHRENTKTPHTNAEAVKRKETIEARKLLKDFWVGL